MYKRAGVFYPVPNRPEFQAVGSSAASEEITDIRDGTQSLTEHITIRMPQNSWTGGFFVVKEPRFGHFKLSKIVKSSIGRRQVYTHVVDG